ncbi:MAG: cob(I)yrinic acid a,c-diamide adenosyltransferase [Streptosporangiaceae bacterium]
MTEDQSTSHIVLSKIYTRTGDEGTTALGDMSRVSKNDSRIHAYADCEEANAAIGVALALGGTLTRETVNLLGRVQNDLFDVGADLAAPLSSETRNPPIRIDASYVEFLESACDHHNEGLPTLRSFILPGGTVAASLLHLARTVVRRAERTAWRALDDHGDGVNPYTARYLNRLSDLLFILARTANAEHGDMLWRPGLATVQPEAAEESATEEAAPEQEEE